MVRQGLSALFAVGLLCLSGLAFAEPAADRDRTDTGAGTDVWGDPEDNEDADSGWTWFGMGYERRARSRGAAGVGESDNAHAPNDTQKQGK